MIEPRHTRCLIVGSGPAGYTAAIYAARALLNPVLIAGIQPGGQLTITTDVENYPGFADVIQGPWLMEQMAAQAAHVGTELVNDIVLSADLSKRPFHIKCDSGAEWLAEKLNGNISRDRLQEDALREAGWQVEVVWECDSVERLRDLALALKERRLGLP